MEMHKIIEGIKVCCVVENGSKSNKFSYTYFIKLYSIIWFVSWCHCSSFFMSLFTLWNKHNITNKRTHANHKMEKFSILLFPLIIILLFHPPSYYDEVFFIFPPQHILYIYIYMCIVFYLLCIHKTTWSMKYTLIYHDLSLFIKSSGIWMTQYLLIKEKNKKEKHRKAVVEIFSPFFSVSLLLFFLVDISLINY